MDIYYILKGPVVTEKAALLSAADDNKRKVVFTCFVHLDADKASVKKACEYHFKVEVDKVRIVNIGPRKRRFKGVLGFHKRKRKAYITLKSGQKIDF